MGSEEDECYDADEQVIRALLVKRGYDPDLPAAGFERTRIASSTYV